MKFHKKTGLAQIRLMLLALLFCIFPQLSNLHAQIHDLDTMKQDFVLKTKRIIIPGYPDAFNPSIVRWQNKLLMSFRYRDPLTQSTDQIALVWLDANFNPTSQPVLLQRNFEITCGSSNAQDPRLIIVNKKLYVVYSNIVTNGLTCVGRMIAAEVYQTNNNFLIYDPTPFLFFDGENINKKEKNWTPFSYNNKLYLAYSINPHIIFTPSFILDSCTTVASTQANINWPWGQLRGGSQALLVNGQYLSFFHSVKALQSVQSGGKLMTHYFMGAYTFDPAPPFALNAISPHPIVAKAFYNGPMYVNWEPLCEVFPCGYVFDANNIYVTYGRQDHECWVVTLDKAGLLNSLQPVSQ